MDIDSPFARLDRIRIDLLPEHHEGSFAGKLGVSKQAYSTWKNRRGLPAKMVAPVLEALRGMGVQVTTDWLLLGVGEKPYKGAPNPQRHPDQHIARVIELMESTDATGRMEAFAAVRETLREYERSKSQQQPKKISA